MKKLQSKNMLDGHSPYSSDSFDTTRPQSDYPSECMPSVDAFDTTAGLVPHQSPRTGQNPGALEYITPLTRFETRTSIVSPTAERVSTPADGKILPAHEQRSAQATRTEDSLYIPGWNYFFRSTHTNNAMLATHIAPHIQAARPENGSAFKVWEAACGRGKDTWSMAAAFAIQGVDFRIHATDVNYRSVAIAQAARYHVDPSERNDFTLGIEQWKLPPETAHLFKEIGDTLQPTQQLRDRVSFDELDLRHQAPAIGEYDAVVANNLFIHFCASDYAPTVRAMLRTITAGLRKGGLFTFNDMTSRNFALQEPTLAEYGLVPAPNIYGAKNWKHVAFYEKVTG